MKKFYLIIALAILAVAIFQAPAVFAAAEKSTKSSVKKAPAKKVAPKKSVSKKVKGKATAKKVVYSIAALIGCVGPDGKNFKATQKDCDYIRDFWNRVNPPKSNNSNSNNSSNASSGGSSNNSSNNNSNQIVPFVTAVSVLPCTSSSCQGITTVVVDGANLLAGTKVEAIDRIRPYNEATLNAQTVGGNGSTQVITDFYNLPACTSFNIKVFLPSGASAGKDNAFSTACL